MDTILLVEDNEDLRSIIFDILSDEFRVKAFKDAESLLTSITEVDLKPALVITDFNLPCMDGVTLAKTLAIKTPKTKVVLMSANIFLDSSLFPDNVIKFFPKPFKVIDLKTYIQNHFHLKAK